MEEMQIDWFTVLVAALANMIIGFFWYSEWLFGKTWRQLSQQPGKERKRSSQAILYEAVASLVIAFFLTFFAGRLGVTIVSDGMFVGFCLWLGFVVTTQLSAVIWGKRPFQLFLVEAGYRLLSYVVMGGLIAA